MSVTFPLTSRVAITSGELRTRLSTAKISWPDACPHQLPACRLQHDALLAHPLEWLHDHRFNHAYRAIHQTLDYCRRSSATGSPAAAVRNSVSCQMRRTSSATLGSPRHNPPDQPNCRKGREVFKPKNWLDRVFEIGIIGKGLNGAAELVGGLLLLFLTPDRIHHLVASLTQGELSEDPHDFVATHLLHTANGLTGQAVLFGAVYLMAHGTVKVVLVIALLLNKLWAYPWMIIVLVLFIGYQLYRIVLHPTAGLIALTVFDVLIVALTWREYRQQRRIRTEEAVTAPIDDAAGGIGAVRRGR
jgi:uncharacterized membrane protein